MLKLTEKQKSLYKKLKFALYFFTFLGLTYFSTELLFPTFKFNYYENGSKNDNTITKPYLTKNGSAFDVSTFGNFDTAKIIINLSNNEQDLPRKTILKLRKSYGAFLSPISTKKQSEQEKITVYQIENKFYLLRDSKLCPFVSEEAFNSYKNKEILNGDSSLFEQYSKSNEVIGFADGSILGVQDDGVYVIENSEKRPIGDEFILQAFGFNDNQVQFVNSEELSVNKKASMFLMPDHHPNGTVFYTTDTQKYFLFNNHSLTQIDSSDKFIEVEEESRDMFVECELKKNWMNSYVCNLDLKDIEKFKGNFYEFTVVNIPELKVKSIEVQFSQKLNKENLIRRITKIKDLFSNRY